MVGKVDYDETRLRNITSRVAGRLDRLYVDYTGVPVRQGDHLVDMYSPEVLAAQEELIQALAALESLKGSDIEIIRETARATIEAARGKLQLWGLLPEQIKEIEQRGKTSDHITIYAPMSGIVIHKNAVEGMYVQTGTRIYTIADFSQVWVKLDAYESDLKLLHYGQNVEFTTISYPGEVFTGSIVFIDPVLNAKTRTVKIRVNTPNAHGKLKPQMFVKAQVRAKLAVGGKVIAPNLRGKWISPMHPEIIKDAPGKCDICGMDLVPAEELGFVSADPAKTEMPLVIPVSAALRTGKRTVVYVQLPGTDKPTFEGREVVLGPRAGDYYIVHSGLEEGELVVTHGNFKIDSALQIQAKPSMLSPEAAPAAGSYQHH
jgi:Cu(I)/Ag(I) efflux system membrane fusion protein